MTTEIAEPSPPAAAAATKSPFERIAGVLFAPVETFRDIARKPDVLVPLLLIIALGFVSTALTVGKMDTESIVAQQREAMRKQNPNASEADAEQMGKVVGAMAKGMAWAGPVLGVIWYLIMAAVLLLAFKMFGGEGTFKHSLSTVLYAWMPMVLFGIVLTIVVVMQGTWDPNHIATLVKSNPAFLVDMKEQPLLYALLSSLDIFLIWMIVLLIVGYSEVFKTSRAKSATIVLSLWAITILIKLGFAAMNAARA